MVVGVLLCAQLTLSIAVACEGEESPWTENEGKAVCPVFKKKGDKCTITKVNLSPLKIEWESNEFVGTKGAERYAFAKEGCETKPGHLTKWAPGAKCTDEIEAIKFEAGTENKRCYTMKDEASGKTRTECLDVLKME